MRHLWCSLWSSLPEPTPRPGPPPPNQNQSDVTEQHRALQVAGRGGSCTHKEIIETELFMLVGKGAWIWIKPCTHFANYPASLLKEKRAHCRFSSQFHPVEPASTYVHTVAQITAATATTIIFFPLMYITGNAPLNLTTWTYLSETKLTEDSNPASYQRAQEKVPLRDPSLQALLSYNFQSQRQPYI